MAPEDAELDKVRVLFKGTAGQDIPAEGRELGLQIFCQEAAENHVTVEDQVDVVDGDSEMP